MNRETRGGLVVVSSTLVAGLFLAAVWTDGKYVKTPGQFALSAIVVICWALANWLLRV